MAKGLYVHYVCTAKINIHCQTCMHCKGWLQQSLGNKVRYDWISICALNKTIVGTRQLICVGFENKRSFITLKQVKLAFVANQTELLSLTYLRLYQVSEI